MHSKEVTQIRIFEEELLRTKVTSECYLLFEKFYFRFYVLFQVLIILRLKISLESFLQIVRMSHGSF